MWSKSKTEMIRISHDGSFSVDAEVARALWPPLYADQWFRPHIRLTLKNTGRDIRSGSLQCQIREYPFADPSSVTSVQDRFLDVAHFPLKEFTNGETRRFSFRIPSRFLQPMTYFARFRIMDSRPADSVRDEIKRTVSGLALPTAQLDATIQQIVQHIGQLDPSMDVDAPQTNVSYSTCVIDCIEQDVIKVLPMLQTASLLIGIPGGIAATVSIALLFGGAL